jgi:hypothetical protein
MQPCTLQPIVSIEVLPLVLECIIQRSDRSHSDGDHISKHHRRYTHTHKLFNERCQGTLAGGVPAAL